MQLEIKTPDQSELLKSANSFLLFAVDFKIETHEQYQIAAYELGKIKTRTRELDDQRRELTRPLDESKKKIMDLFRRPLDLLSAAESAHKSSIIKYQEAEENKRKQEQARLDEIARKERDKLEAQARKADQEARAKAEEFARKAEEARAAGDAEKAEKIETKAECAIEKAEDKIAYLQQQAQAMPAPIVARQTPKVSGLSIKTIWRARVIDPLQVPREYTLIDESALNKIAEATRGSIKIPGVEFYGQMITSSARR